MPYEVLDRSRRMSRMGVVRAFVSRPKHALGKWHSVHVVRDNFFSHILSYWYFQFAEQGLPRQTTKPIENRLRLYSVSSWSASALRSSDQDCGSVLSRVYTTAEYVEYELLNLKKI